MSFCNYCSKPIAKGYDIWISQQPYHPDCAIQVAAIMQNERKDEPTKMTKKTDKKTTTPVKRDCAFCGEHILATCQVPWEGRNYHEDCIGKAITAKRSGHNLIHFPSALARPEPADYADYPDSEEYYDELEDEEYDFPADDEREPEPEENGHQPIVPEVLPPAAPMTSVGAVANSVVQETLEKAKRAGSLITHAGAKRITREDLAILPVPPETATFKPIPHKDLVDRIMDTLWYRRMSVVREEYAVSPDGMKLFGLLEIDLEYKGVRFAIGLRNSNDKSMRVAMVAGYRVTVCDNMMLQGDFQPLLAKHSKNFALEDGLSIACDRIQRNIGGLNQQITAKQEKPIHDELAREIIYRAFLVQKLPMSLMRRVHQEYFIEPSYQEFAANTLWSLENSFTTAFKKLQPIQQFEATARLGRFLSPYLVETVSAA